MGSTTWIAISVGVLLVIFAVKLAMLKITGNAATARWSTIAVLLGLLVFGVALYFFTKHTGA